MRRRSIGIVGLLALALTLGAASCKKKAKDDSPGGGMAGGDMGAGSSTAATGKPRVTFKTSVGSFVVELWPDKAPITVKNFLAYIDSKFFDGTIFHRVVQRGARSRIAVIQGGGFTASLQKKPTRAPIKNEADNGLKNTRGTLSMARTQALHSATSQFFVNVQDNPLLDHGGPLGFGYAVFGKVVSGMEVVEKIYRTPTQSRGGPFASLPMPTPVIQSVTRVGK